MKSPTLKRHDKLCREFIARPSSSLPVFLTTAFTHVTASTATFVGQILWIDDDRIGHFDAGTIIGALQHREFISLEDFNRWFDHKDNRKRFVHPVVQRQVDRFRSEGYPSA